MKLKITKIAVFDYDGTFIDTPLPDEGKLIYQEKTGKPWPHIGWWGKAESLDMTIFDMPVIESTFIDYKNVINDDETLVIMLTGRMAKLAPQVEAILDSKDIKFDEYHYNKGGTTFDAKILTLEKLLKKYPEVTSISMWDDRDLHVDGFKAWGESHPQLSEFTITLVPANRH